MSWSVGFESHRGDDISACGGDQGQLSGTFADVKARRPQLVLGWMTTEEDRAP